MTTAQEIITTAAKDAGILAEGQTLEAGINARALKTLNTMISRWQNNGIDLGLATLALADTLYIDDADEEAVTVQLALRLAVNHRRNITAGLSAAGNDALTELQAKYTIINEMPLDRTITRRNTFRPRSDYDINTQ